jgi:Cu(I)/Ag(I) efflux system membrane protein CusA/SilA
MATLPFALTGGAWFLYLLGFNLSVATGVGFIALAGVSAEFGVIMLLYLKMPGPSVKTSVTTQNAG